MPRVSEIAIISYPERPALVIRTTVPEPRLPMVIGQSFGAIGGYLAQTNETPADMPYIRFANEDLEALQIEIGFIMPKALPGNDTVQSVTLPAEQVVCCMYQGPYGPDQAPVYEEMQKWIADKGLTATGETIEQYYNGEEFPPHLFLTKISLPIR